MLDLALQGSFKNSELCRYLNQEELERLFTRNRIVSFASGETLLQQGKEADGLYIVIEGMVTVTAKLLGAGTTNLETLGTGSILGEISYIENIPCATSIIAIEPVQALFVDRNYLELLSAYYPETKYKLYTTISKQVCRRLNRVHDKITEFISKSEMTTKSFFGEFIHSLTTPAEISFEEANLNQSMLAQFQSLQNFTASELEEICKHSMLLKAAKNCTLIHIGEKDAACYLVIQGAVQSSIAYNNRFAKLSVIGPTILFASVGCIDHHASFAITFATCERSILLKLSDTDLQLFQKSNPILWYKIFDLICRSLVALEKSVDKLDIRLNIETYNR